MFDCALILAGGRGKRLRPFTDAIPKPMLPYGDKPILRHIIDGMIPYGINKFFLSVNYKKEIIKSYFGDGSKLGVQISYIEEKKPTGTVGCLTLFNEPCEYVLLSNGDVIADIDYSAMFGVLKSSDLVITGIKRHINIDFGVLDVGEDGRLLSWEEKPSYEYIINAGVYGINKRVIDFVKHNYEPETYLDMPDLWRALLDNDFSIKVYISEGKWEDIGRVEDYMRLLEKGV